jgi:hypothetical protein
MNNKEFSIRLKQCISSIFNNIDEKEDLFEFGIFTNQDISTIVIAYNTRTHFAAQLEKYFLEENRIVSYYRWSMPEWYQEIGDENILLNDINDILYNVIQPNQKKINPENFKNNILDLLFNSLVELRNEGLFNSIKGDLILYLEQADSFIGELMRERIKILIGEEHYKFFLFDMGRYAW